MKNYFSLFIISLLCLHLAISQSTIEVGAKCPPITVSDWLKNIPTDTSLSGKIVVIDFWATWCGPCIKAVPHFNELKHAFEDDPQIIFMSMTDESSEKVSRILERIDFQSAVVSDQTGQTQKAFGIKAIPYTLVIDEMGKLAWKGHPEGLSVEMIQKVKADVPITSLENEKNASKAMDYQKTETTNNAGLKELMMLRKNPDSQKDFQLIPTTQKNGIVMNMLPVLYYAAGTHTVKAIASFLDVAEYRIEATPSVSESRFNISYIDKSVRDVEEAKTFILSSMLETYHLKMKEEERTVETLNIGMLNKEELRPSSSSQGSISDAGDKTVYTNQSIKAILTHLEDRLNIPMVDETGLEGNYDFILENSSREALIKSLESYGLSVEVGKKNMVFYQIVSE